MGKVMLDSSVLIALMKESDHHHRSAVEAVKGHSGEIVISVAVLSESLVHAYKGGEAAVRETKKAILGLVASVYPIDSQIAVEASRLRASKKLVIGDAFIGATANILDIPMWTFDKTLSSVVAKGKLLK